MAESRILLLFCFLIFCLSGSNIIGGQKVSGISLRDRGRSVHSWCVYGVGGYQSSWYLSDVYEGPDCQAVVPPPQAEVCGCST